MLGLAAAAVAKPVADIIGTGTAQAAVLSPGTRRAADVASLIEPVRLPEMQRRQRRRARLEARGKCWRNPFGRSVCKGLGEGKRKGRRRRRMRRD